MLNQKTTNQKHVILAECPQVSKYLIDRILVTMKKIILLTVAALFFIIGMFIFLVNAKDNYHNVKYTANIPTEFIVGSSLNFTLPDQFKTAHTLSKNTNKLIIVPSTKGAGYLMKDFLQDKEKGYLDSISALYIFDISGVPNFIRNRFILAELQKSTYPVLIILNEDIATSFIYEPRKGDIKIVTLDNRNITNIQFVTTLKEFAEAMKSDK